MSVGTCSSCGAPIKWVHTKNGKRMPLNLWPDLDSGNVVVIREHKPVEIFATNARASVWLATHDGRGPYTTHFETCKFAARHRRPLAKPVGEPPPEAAQVQEQLL